MSAQRTCPCVIVGLYTAFGLTGTFLLTSAPLAGWIFTAGWALGMVLVNTLVGRAPGRPYPGVQHQEKEGRR